MYIDSSSFATKNTSDKGATFEELNCYKMLHPHYLLNCGGHIGCPKGKYLIQSLVTYRIKGIKLLTHIDIPAE